MLELSYHATMPRRATASARFARASAWEMTWTGEGRLLAARSPCPLLPASAPAPAPAPCPPAMPCPLASMNPGSGLGGMPVSSASTSRSRLLMRSSSLPLLRDEMGGGCIHDWPMKWCGWEEAEGGRWLGNEATTGEKAVHEVLFEAGKEGWTSRTGLEPPHPPNQPPNQPTNPTSPPAVPQLQLRQAGADVVPGAALWRGSGGAGVGVGGWVGACLYGIGSRHARALAHVDTCVSGDTSAAGRGPRRIKPHTSSPTRLPHVSRVMSFGPIVLCPAVGSCPNQRCTSGMDG